MTKKVTFEIDGVEGSFVVDADEFKNYKTIKQLAFSGVNAAGCFEAMERLFMGKDEEYVERVGGVGNMETLLDAAANAAKVKK